MRYMVLIVFCVFLAACVAKAGVLRNMLQTKPYPSVFFTGDELKVAQAIKAKNIDKAKALAEKLPDINARGTKNFTLLAFAVADHNLPAIKMLMKLGASPELEVGDDEIGRLTIGHLAMLEVNADGLNALLEGGMNPDQAYGSGTLLHRVPDFAENDSLKHLVEHGANVNAKDSLGQTPLFNLVLTSFDEALYLLENGADPFVMDDNGLTLAHSVQDSLESMDKTSEAYQKMLRIQQKMIEQGVQFPALSVFGERTRLKMVYCKEPSGWQLPANCKVQGELPHYFTEPPEKIRLRDEKILRERYGMDVKVQLRSWL